MRNCTHDFDEKILKIELIRGVQTAGKTGSIINVLIVGNHFVRLYNLNEDEVHRLQAEQIMKNCRELESVLMNLKIERNLI